MGTVDLPIKRPTAYAALAASLLAACGGAEPRPNDEAAPVVAILASPGGTATEKLRAGDPAGARAAYEAALAADPDRLAPLNDLAVAYLVQGHGEAARRLLDEVVAHGSPPEQQAALLNLGELYALDGYPAAAEAYLETARGLDPERPGSWYALALLADARGQLDQARAAIREAVRLDDGAAARAELAYVYPEERVHLEALVAEQAGDAALAAARWRELAASRYGSLSAAAERHLSGE